jgi:hypothetical protein
MPGLFIYVSHADTSLRILADGNYIQGAAATTLLIKLSTILYSSFTTLQFQSSFNLKV